MLFHTTRRVAFRDTDAAGIAHFSAFFAYMEDAEHEFLRSLGFSVVMHDSEGTLSWPRVSVQCDYRAAAKFEDVLDIELSITRMGEKSVTYEFTFSRSGDEIAGGRMTAVCCRIVPGKPPQSQPIPVWIAEKLRPFAV